METGFDISHKFIVSTEMSYLEKIRKISPICYLLNTNISPVCGKARLRVVKTSCPRDVLYAI